MPKQDVLEIMLAEGKASEEPLPRILLQPCKKDTPDEEMQGQAADLVDFLVGHLPWRTWRAMVDIMRQRTASGQDKP